MTKLALSHYFTPYTRSEDNALAVALGGAGDYYDRRYLYPYPGGADGPGSPTTYGGILRDRPIPRIPLSGDFEYQDMQWEIATAKTYGLDGFTVDLLEIDTTGGSNFSGIGQNARRVKKLLNAADADGSFTIVLMPDMSGWRAQSATAVGTTCANLAAAHASVHREGGKVVLAPFYPETKAASFYNDVAAVMTGLGQPPVFVPCFLDYGGNVATFKSTLGTKMIGASNWGNRSPAGNVVSANTALAADAHGRGLLWMQPISFQDVRPDQFVYAEPENTHNLRLTWQAARDGNAEWVQCVTWNDFSEGTQFVPSRDHGYVLTELNGWFIAWWKAGSMPTIVHDSLILTHRKHPYAATATGGMSHYMSLWQVTAAVDRVECFARLASAGTVVLTSGSNVQTLTGVTGLQILTVPLVVGSAPYATLSR